MTRDRLVFQHIPKTAGSTLQTLLIRQFPRNEMFICGKDGVLSDFLSLEPRARDELSILIGHVDYGIHKQFNGDSMYFTFLRDPLERTISHYYFILNDSSHRYNQQARNMSLGQFIKSGIRPRMNNCLTRMISGRDGEYGNLSPQLVDIAIENLKKHYFFVGFMNGFDGWVDKLCTRLGWTNKSYITVNVSKNRPNFNELDKIDQEPLIEHNRLDIELYRRVITNNDLQGTIK